MVSTGRSNVAGIVLIALGVIAYVWLRGQVIEEWFQLLIGLYLVYYWNSNRQSATPWVLGLGIVLIVDHLEEIVRGVSYQQGDFIRLFPATVLLTGLIYLFGPSAGQRRTTTGIILLAVGAVWHYISSARVGGSALATILAIVMGLYVLYVWNQHRSAGGAADPWTFGWGVTLFVGAIARYAGVGDTFPGILLVGAGIASLLPPKTA